MCAERRACIRGGEGQDMWLVGRWVEGKGTRVRNMEVVCWVCRRHGVLGWEMRQRARKSRVGGLRSWVLRLLFEALLEMPLRLQRGCRVSIRAV